MGNLCSVPHVHEHGQQWREPAQQRYDSRLQLHNGALKPASAALGGVPPGPLAGSRAAVYANGYAIYVPPAAGNAMPFPLTRAELWRAELGTTGVRAGDCTRAGGTQAQQAQPATSSTTTGTTTTTSEPAAAGAAVEQAPLHPHATPRIIEQQHPPVAAQQQETQQQQQQQQGAAAKAAQSAGEGALVTPTAPVDTIVAQPPQPAPVAQPPQPPAPQAPINWTKGKLIGAGAFGRVFQGLDNDTGHIMAVKQVALTKDETLKGRVAEHIKALEAEVAVLRQLNHKNIVRYLGTERTDDTLNIFLEYVPGGSIASLIEKFGPLQENVVRLYTQQILQGLEYLHQKKIMHRDIKGANILVDPQ